MAGKFEIFKDKKGEFRFRLKASNGQTVLTSEGYKGKSSAKNGIASVQKNGTNPARFDKSTTKSGLHRFSLMAANKQVIGQSENYKSASSRDNGVEAVGRAADGAAVVDMTV
jgi:uncharacterized protein YegP (UPF0339 family)